MSRRQAAIRAWNKYMFQGGSIDELLATLRKLKRK